MRLFNVAGILALGCIRLLAGDVHHRAKPIVAVCMSSQLRGEAATEAAAFAIATRMLGDAGVTLVRKRPSACPTDGIHLELTDQTPASLRPGTLGFAMPFEGTRIRVFADRIVGNSNRPKFEARLMGHVFAHEITHILEGVLHHSEQGVMKAHWDANEIFAMQWKDLPFDPEDVTLIRTGIEARMRKAGRKTDPN